MKQRVFGWVLVLAVLELGCGGDPATGTPPQTASGTGAVAAAGGGAAAAGSGGSLVSAAGSSGSAGGSSAGVRCGTTTCTLPPPNPGLSANPPPPCCSNDAMSICGTMVSGMCMPPPAPAPGCPMVAFGQTKPCCITESNTCGVDASAYGKGCLDISASMGGLKTLCDGTVVRPPGSTAGAGTAAGAGGASAGAGGAAAGASGAGSAGRAAAGAGGAAAGSGGAVAGSGGRG